MSICEQCKEQGKKNSRSKPHEQLSKVGEQRIFKGVKSRRFEEQDYQCQTCAAKFTQSNNKNDLAWTLWQS
ncbi:hypothetical protein SAMN02745165_02412 [Malonomonas rubra DSM 5091]|uniref:Uncharacterized protein n=1 Tax=Malonomonas rubra DSM 5091 TaxID=1122189 RepID=A0A1M6JDY4_MALRU|nr:hypothetical protein [Malonomonas rubra]SHJ44923.1 hypothetical protein SAMN02745165_02412 [Malonomonas rubra DSM 5091]